MTPEQFYNNQLSSLKTALDGLQKRKSALGWSRFLTIAGIIIGGWLLWPVGYMWTTGLIVIGLFGFVQLVLRDLKNNKAIRYTNNLIEINERELQIMSGDYYELPDGAEHFPHNHLYAHDLDIFGRASLFQYVNRGQSDMGRQQLANWLLEPAVVNDINDRQTALKELSANMPWLQQLQAHGNAQTIETSTRDKLNNWIAEPDRFLNFKPWLLLQYLLPAVMLTVIALNIFDLVSNPLRNYFLLAYAILAWIIAKKAAPIHAQLTKIVEELEVMVDSMILIENANFNAALLKNIQVHYQQNSVKASAELKRLKAILERMDLRYNPVVFVPLAIVLVWDLHQVLALEKWKRRNQQQADQWFKALGQLEAIGSFASLHFNHPEWILPTIKESNFFIEGKNIGHPLIPAARRVNNPIDIPSAGELMIITGSNMAGKSTYLRSVGVNVILAMAGAPVCASEFKLSPVQLVSSMRIADNLEESTSTFYAELKKLKTIIDLVNDHQPVFILLDEILRGTNSLDRHIGSKALMQQLIKQNACCIIATHDVELAKLKDEYPKNILTYYFDVQVSNEELYFDYKLKDGICNSLNASILMKKIGIEL